MIIKGARHRIKSYYWMNMNISKEYYHHQKYLERLMCTLAFELFIVNGRSELKANNRWWSEVARVVFSQFFPSCHTSSRLLCVDSLIFIVGLTHLDYENCSFIIHRVRTQSIRAIECRLLCVIHRGLLRSNITVCQMLLTCVFIFYCSRYLCLDPNFWISSHVV
jgi:hypothetical protein